MQDKNIVVIDKCWKCPYSFGTIHIFDCNFCTIVEMNYDEFKMCPLLGMVDEDNFYTKINGYSLYFLLDD